MIFLQMAEKIKSFRRIPRSLIPKDDEKVISEQVTIAKSQSVTESGEVGTNKSDVGIRDVIAEVDNNVSGNCSHILQELSADCNGSIQQQFSSIEKEDEIKASAANPDDFSIDAASGDSSDSRKLTIVSDEEEEPEIIDLQSDEEVEGGMKCNEKDGTSSSASSFQLPASLEDQDLFNELLVGGNVQGTVICLGFD